MQFEKYQFPSRRLQCGGSQWARRHESAAGRADRTFDSSGRWQCCQTRPSPQSRRSVLLNPARPALVVMPSP